MRLYYISSCSKKRFKISSVIRPPAVQLDAQQQSQVSCRVTRVNTVESPNWTTQFLLLCPTPFTVFAHIDIVWGGKGRSLKAASTNHNRNQEEENKINNVDAEEQARWNTECVGVREREMCLNYHCLQQWEKRFVSHRKTLSLLLFLFWFFFVSLCCCLTVWGRTTASVSVVLWRRDPSDDFKGLLQLHYELPVRLLHFVSEPVLKGVDGRPSDLKQKHIVVFIVYHQ